MMIIKMVAATLALAYLLFELYSLLCSLSRAQWAIVLKAVVFIILAFMALLITAILL